MTAYKGYLRVNSAQADINIPFSQHLFIGGVRSI